MLFTLYLTLSAIALCSVSAAPSSNALPLGKESRGLLKRQQLVPLCNQPANSTLTTPCQLCRTTFTDPYSKTCTSAAITSCVNGRLVYNGNTCVTACPACPANFHPDSNNLTCVADPKCSSTQYLNANKTACVNCADRRATKCDATGVLACGFGLVPKGTSCACPTGQYFTGFTTCTACTATYGPNVLTCSSSSAMSCAAGYSLSSDNLRCICSSGTTSNLGSGGATLACVSCTQFDTQAATCNGTLSGTQVVGTIKTCKTGFKPTALGDKCICSDVTKQRVGDSCQACPVGSTCNGTTTATACNFGLNVDTCNSTQVLTCATGFSISNDAKSCVCSAGGTSNLGAGGQALACVPCATFDSQAATCTAALNATGQLVPSIQTCKTGFVPNATGDSCICKLTTQQRVNSTTCQACPTSYTCNGGPSAICAGSQIDGACSRVFNTSTRLVTSWGGTIDGGASVNDTVKCAVAAAAQNKTAATVFFNLCFFYKSLNVTGSTMTYRYFFNQPDCPTYTNAPPALSPCTNLFLVESSNKCYLDKELTVPCNLTLKS